MQLIIMGNCMKKSEYVYIVTENSKLLECTYDLQKAEQYFTKPFVPNRELIQYLPDSKEFEKCYCIKHTYLYN